jgi:hypothetical protein
MSRRRLGRAAVRDLAGSPSLEIALSVLSRSPYGRAVRPGQTLATAQHGAVETVLWNARVLAGWAPRPGVAALRVLAGWLEAANVDDLLNRQAGGEPAPPYRLGGLATAWPRLARSGTPADVRRALATSLWGDPGGESPREVALTMRAVLADRVISAVPCARAWAAGATALLVAREVVLGGRPLPEPARVAAARVVGPAAATALDLGELVAALPSSAGWALAGVEAPADLWRAEARWWGRVDREGGVLAFRSTPGPEVLVGAVAMMAADAWRVRAALESAARGGLPQEVLDAVA